MDAILIEAAGQVFALPSAQVERIAEASEATPLPFVADYVDGLVNIGNAVLPQICLHLRLGLKKIDSAGVPEVLLVREGSDGFVLRCDRVLGFHKIGDDGWHAFSETSGSTLAKFVAGEFLYNDKPVLMLTPKALAMEDIIYASDTDAVQWGADQSLAVTTREEALRYLLVRIAGQRYALPLMDISEVLDAVNETRLPQAPPEVAGLISLRGQPLLCLEMASLLSLTAQTTACCLVVVECGQHRLGLKVEALNGIGSSQQMTHHPVHDNAVLKAYLSDDDNNIIGLLNLDQLFDAIRLERYKSFLTTSAVADDARSTCREKLESYLSFRVGNEHCGVPMRWVDRVERYSAASQLPESQSQGENTADALDGLVVMQGDVVPVVDLRRRFGSEMPLGELACYVIVRDPEGNSRWALLVDSLNRIINLPTSAIEPVRSNSGYFDAIGKLNNQLISLLRLERLIQREAA